MIKWLKRKYKIYNIEHEIEEKKFDLIWNEIELESELRKLGQLENAHSLNNNIVDKSLSRFISERISFVEYHENNIKSINEDLKNLNSELDVLKNGNKRN